MMKDGRGEEAVYRLTEQGKKSLESLQEKSAEMIAGEVAEGGADEAGDDADEQENVG